MNTLLEKIVENKPLIHCLTNEVTETDCANILLSIGASPIMSTAHEEMNSISKLSQAAVINIGTPSNCLYDSQRKIVQNAKKNDVPIVLDPVGIGVSSFRKNHVKQLLNISKPALVRCNLGETQSLLGMDNLSLGIDSRQHLDWRKVKEIAIQMADELQTTVLITGANDVIASQEKTCVISGGTDLITKITGGGDMLTAICAALLSVTNSSFEAAKCAAYFWKVIGYLGSEKSSGLGDLHQELFNIAGDITTIDGESHNVKIIEEASR